MAPLLQTQPFDVTDWVPDELYANYPEGARSKLAIFPPADLDQGLIIPGRRYLFKRTLKYYPDQFWAEIIAYLVGCAVDVVVPPAFAAHNRETGYCAALIEWFYVDGEASLIAGGNYMQLMDSSYDRKRGEKHNFRYISALGAVFSKNGMSDDDWQLYWARAILFDALIGNTDRHQDNWGYLRRGEKLTLSPLFDNGTSLGHERFTDRVAGWKVADLERYVERGMHQMKWSVHDEERCRHFDMVKRIVQRFPHVRADLQGMIDSFSVEELEPKLRQLEQLNLAVRLTGARADFCLKLLALRKNKIILALQ